jgi:hypothetical protein
MYYNPKWRSHRNSQKEQRVKTYYTAEEAMKILDLPRSTFHYLVRKGEIPKINVPLRKQAVYPKKEIDKLAEERNRVLTELEVKNEELAFVIPNRDDLEQLLEIERIRYPEETLFSPDTIEQRMQYSPENIHVLKNAKTNTVLGSITMSPMKIETLERLINLEIDDTKVAIKDYLPYSQNMEQDVYIMSIVAKPTITEKYHAGKLLIATLDYIKDLLDKGIEIKKIYCVATTEEGEKLAKNLQFTSLKTEWTGDHEDFRHSYVLDIRNINSRHKLVRNLQNHIKNAERRKRRYDKRDTK